MQATSKSKTTQPQNKGTYRRRRIYMLVLVCIIGWAGYSLWDANRKIGEREGKLEALKQKEAESLQTNQELKREITRLNDPEYVEQKIRQELHYVKNSRETLFYTPTPPKK